MSTFVDELLGNDLQAVRRLVPMPLLHTQTDMEPWMNASVCVRGMCRPRSDGVRG